MNFLMKIKDIILAPFVKRTIGARILLINNNKILLVKHTYQSGWYTIGGGINRGETPIAAVQRELKEETGITLKSVPTLFSVYYSNFQKHDDYIVLYVGNEHIQEDCWSVEILEKKWFDLDKLPPDVTPATKRRIDEYLGKTTICDRW